MKVIFKKGVGKSEKHYDMLSVDLGYEKVALTFDSNVIAQVLGCSRKELAARPVGESVVGEFNITEKGVK